MGLEFRRVTGEAATQVLDERHVELYLATRAESPYLSGPLYQPDRYLERTGRQVKRPGFAAVSAEDGPVLVGFAFGVPLASWWGGHATPAPPEVAEAPSLFAVIELNVRQDHRNQGIGRKLLDELLSGQEAPYATVLANPAAPAHDMYLRWGWRKVGTVQAAPDAMISDALIRKLPG